MRPLKRIRLWLVKKFSPETFTKIHCTYRGLKFLIRSLLIFFTRVRCVFGVRALDNKWGNDRGQNVMRYYLEQFLTEFQEDIQGHVMEFQDDGYIRKYGRDRVTQKTIVCKEMHENATLICDITQSGSLPRNTFDVIICTHVLHVVDGLDAAIKEFYESLKPGGVLLIGSPHVSMSDPNWGELWRFTREGMQTLLEKKFDPKDILVRAYGNSLVSAGSLRGLASEDFLLCELSYTDERFATEICARAKKRQAS